MDTLYNTEIQLPFFNNNESVVPIASIKRCQPETIKKVKNKVNFLTPVPSIASIKSHWKLESQTSHDTYFENNNGTQKVTRVEEPKVPQNLPAVIAANCPDGQLGLDTRPRFLEGISKKFCLVDSGSAIIAVAAGPDDSVIPSLSLIAANGSKIECCGYKEINIRINRKTYKMVAAIAKIEDTIIGWDFIKKFKLNFEWQGEDCYLHDRKANVRKRLEYITLPHQSKPHLQSVQSTQADQADQSGHPLDLEMLFNTSAITKIDSESVDNSKKPISQKYQNLLNKYPGLLKTEFKAKDNGNPVIHYIHTTGKPCKARLRPLMKGSPKEIKGKEAWQELIDYGIVEPVDNSQPFGSLLSIFNPRSPEATVLVGTFVL